MAKEEDAFVELTSPGEAEWVVRTEPPILVLTSGKSGCAPSFPLDAAHLEAELANRLAQLARARNLLALAAEPRDGQTRSQVVVEVLMESRKGEDDEKGVLLDATKRAAVRHGQWVGFRIVNKGPQKADATLLFINSHGQIKPLFPNPRDTRDNRIPSGASVGTHSFQVDRRTIGQEHVVLIAVERVGSQVDFSYLCDPTLRDMPLRDTSLGRLLHHALFRIGHTRGVDVADNHCISVLSWRVV